MGDGVAEQETQDRYRRRYRRLRFAEPGIEATYRRWRSEQAAPLVRVGMVFLLLGGFTIVATGLVLDEPYGETFIGINALVVPGFLASIAVTMTPAARRWTLPVAAMAATVWGSVLVWSLHNSLDARELGTTAVLLVGLWGLIVLRLPPGLGLLASLSGAVMHQVGLAASDAGTVGTDGLHATVTWLVLVAAVTVSVVVDRGLRTQFAQERIIAEQHEQIDRERRRADALLQNILPDAIADRLKSGTQPIADHHEGVTVLFADVVGFTMLSTQLPAAEVVQLLDDVFHRIDDIIDRHHVEKIKTVGDAYMAVAGAPRPRDDHAEAIADVALDILDALDALETSLPSPVEMRIGIATGDAVAGVIGRKKFAYDLWSDTVNTASRMESHGVPGRIQITEATARRLAARYVVEERGTIEVKGKGPTRTWFLVCRRSPDRTAGRSAQQAVTAPDPVNPEAPPMVQA